MLLAMEFCLRLQIPEYLTVSMAAAGQTSNMDIHVYSTTLYERWCRSNELVGQFLRSIGQEERMPIN